MIALTPEQKATFDAGIEGLRERLAWRKAVMAVPRMASRAADVDRLAVAIDNLRKAAGPFLSGASGFLSRQTSDWLEDVDPVADELRKLKKPRRSLVLARGMVRPNQYREWLIGEQIPALCQKVYGKRFALTLGGWSMMFAHHVLAVLEENDAADETIKTIVSKVRRRVRTSESPTKL